MKLHILYIYLFLLYFSGGEQVSGAPLTDTVSVEISPSTAQITIGDSLTVFCAVTVPDGIQAGDPVPAGDKQFVDISPQWHSTGLSAPGKHLEYYGFLMYVFAPDTLRVGPFTVDYIESDGTPGKAESNVLTLIVKGVVTVPDAAPKPNRGPFSIASKGMPLWLKIILVAVAAALIAIIIRLFRRRKRETPIEVWKPIDEIGEFEHIRSMHLLESGQIKELYFLTSMAIRGFIHRNMGFEALYSTTDEIVMRFARNSHEASVTSAFREILEESDMVKFAKYIPPVDKSATLIDRALVPVRNMLDSIAREQERLEAEQKAATPQTPAKSLPVHQGGK
ncbi:hypothetical protein LLG96_16535 [bacterium]|nr:hypothetical protein [bacterium]